MIAVTPKTILVADDIIIITQILRFGLERAGCRVHVASNGETALRRAETDRIDLLILDIEMPDMSGFDLLREVRRKSGYSEVPVIFITSSGDPKLREEAEALGASGFFTKPFSPVELQRRVMKTLSL